MLAFLKVIKGTKNQNKDRLDKEKGGVKL